MCVCVCVCVCVSGNSHPPQLAHACFLLLPIALQVPYLTDRLDIVIWASDFPLRYEELAPVVIKCYDLFYQLLQSSRLEKVLVYALSIGNYVNSGGSCSLAHITCLPRALFLGRLIGALWSPTVTQCHVGLSNAPCREHTRCDLPFCLTHPNRSHSSFVRIARLCLSLRLSALRFMYHNLSLSLALTLSLSYSLTLTSSLSTRPY